MFHPTGSNISWTIYPPDTGSSCFSSCLHRNCACHSFTRFLKLNMDKTEFLIFPPSQFVKRFINDTWMHRYHLPIADNSLRLLWSFIVSSYCIGGLLGSLGSGYLASKYGKKRCQLCSNVIPITAALLMGLSATDLDSTSTLSMQERLQTRNCAGFTNTSISIFVTTGKLTGQILGLREILGIESQWPLLLAFSGFWALAQMVTLPLFPESPPYLLMEKGDKDGCIKAIKQLWGDQDHQKEIDEMLQEQASRKSGRSLTIRELLREPSLRWQLYMLVALTIALQLCGINAVKCPQLNSWERLSLLS
ncbi:unnamed protein product [Ranitomeya imitator]|uniref:Uncharacterized protein n=1 Tax=Ranitomeya imitator TaxID=111125 RepID=A0ABN9KZ46_9NEOB|nr:unnamed protein product [Ranitomeya imitator]